MREMRKRIFSMLFCMVMTFTALPVQAAEVNLEITEIYETTKEQLTEQVEKTTPTVNSIGGEWLVLGLARSGVEIPKDYYHNVVKYVHEEINDKEQLHRAKSTDNSRVILALTALGYDVTNVAGHNLLNGLTDMEYVKFQGINGPIWALIAFDSHSYEIPKGGDVTREALIAEILDAQLADGGWTLEGETADSDMTGMALQALAPYYESDEEVKEAVNKALMALSGMQNADGGFITVGDPTCESNAQIIVGLTALGIDPFEDERFVKEGKTVMDALCNYYTENGSFSHLLGSERNGMATEQAFYALVSYFRIVNAQTSLYDMSDVEIKVDVDYDINLDDTEDTEESEKDVQVKEEKKETPEGTTKSLDSNESEFVIDGMTYVVDKEAAKLMLMIEQLAKQENADEQHVVEIYKIYSAMSKELKAQIFNYDKFENMLNDIGEKNHKDQTTGMEITGLAWNLKLVAEEVESGDAYNQMAGSIGSNILIKAWNIEVIDILSDEKVQLNEAVTLKVTAPDVSTYEEIIIVHQKEDGQLEYLKCEQIDGYLTWQIESEGMFGLAGNTGEAAMTISEADTEADEESAIAQTNNSVMAIWPWLLMAAVGLIMLITVVIKIKTEKAKDA